MTQLESRLDEQNCGLQPRPAIGTTQSRWLRRASQQLHSAFASDAHEVGNCIFSPPHTVCASAAITRDDLERPDRESAGCRVATDGNAPPSNVTRVGRAELDVVNPHAVMRLPLRRLATAIFCPSGEKPPPEIGPRAGGSIGCAEPLHPPTSSRPGDHTRTPPSFEIHERAREEIAKLSRPVSS